jgi:hypothetical protein
MGWWDDGLVGWWVGGMMGWRADGLVGWWVGGMMGWWDDGLVGWWVGGMMGWRADGLVGWWVGGWADASALLSASLCGIVGQMKWGLCSESVLIFMVRILYLAFNVCVCMAWGGGVLGVCVCCVYYVCIGDVIFYTGCCIYLRLSRCECAYIRSMFSGVKR